MALRTANVIGSGPNGLAAAITLAQAGVGVTVYEGMPRIGGACSTAEITLPGFHHDLGSSAFPMGVASPFFRSLPLASYGFRWIEPEIPLAHPLDHPSAEGSAAALLHSIDAMPNELGAHDGAAWKRFFGPIVNKWPSLVPEILGPVVHFPHHPVSLARFGLPSLLPATALARSLFKDERARALFAGGAMHSVMPLTAPLSSAIGIVFVAAAHTLGWPVAEHGSQSLSDALAAHLRSLGGAIHTSHPVTSLAALPHADATFFDTSTRTLTALAGDRLSSSFQRSLQAFRQGPGIFKIDWALSEPIPWQAASCRRAATIHACGTVDEMARAEQTVFDGAHPERPFVLLVQPSVCDPTRAPAGKHTAWAYTHVPNGSTLDCTAAIESQIERFAPGFRDCILARVSHSTAQLEAWNPNLVGGDISGGAMTPGQLVFRPTRHTYGTSDPTLFLCSSSTPPAGGVHGMCGFHAATQALQTLGRP